MPNLEIQQNFRRVWIAGYLLASFVIGWYILSKNFSPGVSFKESWTPESAVLTRGVNTIISDIYPAERMGLLEKEDSLYFKKVLAEPIYFDVKFPKRFREVSFGIKAETRTEVLLGTKAEPGWRWSLKSLNLQTSNEWNESSVSFSKDKIIVNNRHWARFIIASPEFDSTKGDFKLAKIFIEIK